MTNTPAPEDDNSLYEQVERLFTLRVSSSGADMGIYFKTSKERSGIDSIWIDGDEWIELRKSMEDLIHQQRRQVVEEVLSRLEKQKVSYYVIDEGGYEAATEPIDAIPLSAIQAEGEKL